MGSQMSDKPITFWGLKQTALTVLGSILLLDSVVLLAFKKINAGTILPGCIGLGLLLIAFAYKAIARWQRNKVFQRTWRVSWCLFFIWLVSLGIFVTWNISADHSDADIPEPSSFLVVLGAGLQGKEPSPTLKLRLDRALEIANKRPEIKVIVSGGKGNNEEISEAQAMQDYLVDQGLPASRIMREDRSTSTVENLRFSRLLLKNSGVDFSTTPIGIVTSNFHALRARRIALLEGYQKAWVAAAPVPWWILPNSWLREYFSTSWEIVAKRF